MPNINPTGQINQNITSVKESKLFTDINSFLNSTNPAFKTQNHINITIPTNKTDTKDEFITQEKPLKENFIQKHKGELFIASAFLLGVTFEYRRNYVKALKKLADDTIEQADEILKNKIDTMKLNFEKVEEFIRLKPLAKGNNLKEIIFIISNELFQKKDYKGIIEHVEPIAADLSKQKFLFGNETYCLFHLATAYDQTNQASKAYELLLNLKKNKNINSLLASLLVKIYSNNGLHQAAIKEFEELQALKKVDNICLKAIVKSYKEIGNFDKANEIMKNL